MARITSTGVSPMASDKPGTTVGEDHGVTDVWIFSTIALIAIAEIVLVWWLLVG